MVGFSLLLLHGFSEGLDRRQKHYLRGGKTILLLLLVIHDPGYFFFSHGELEGF